MGYHGMETQTHKANKETPNNSPVLQRKGAYLSQVGGGVHRLIVGAIIVAGEGCKLNKVLPCWRLLVKAKMLLHLHPCVGR